LIAVGHRAAVHCIQVNATKAAMDVALARANMQKNAYEQFKDMMLFDRQLDLASLSPAFKAACGFKGLAAAAASGGTHALAVNSCSSPPEAG
jgi:hypothetical protein